jgi:hypothetical protein
MLNAFSLAQVSLAGQKPHLLNQKTGKTEGQFCKGHGYIYCLSEYAVSTNNLSAIRFIIMVTFNIELSS